MHIKDGAIWATARDMEYADTITATSQILMESFDVESIAKLPDDIQKVVLAHLGPMPKTLNNILRELGRDTVDEVYSDTVIPHNASPDEVRDNAKEIQKHLPEYYDYMLSSAIEFERLSKELKGQNL